MTTLDHDMPCPFCRMVVGQERASYVWDGPNAFGITSLDQPTPYKVLMIPKRHLPTIFDLTDETAAELFQVTVAVARAVHVASGCPGMNLVQSNGRVGQQDVFHFHLHLVPRFEDDGIILKWEDKRVGRTRLDELAAEIGCT